MVAGNMAIYVICMYTGLGVLLYILLLLIPLYPLEILH